jgi:hypothetical protein
MASITVNGDLSDLPFIVTQCCTVGPPSSPIDFGNLLAFDFDLLPAALFVVTLSNFKPACLGPPTSCMIGSWIIAPGEISFGDAFNEFDIRIFSGGNSRISFGGDNLLPCTDSGLFGGLCTVTGQWIAVPEPATSWIFATGLGLMALLAWRRRRGLAACRW